jgi:hypothetical protein
MHMLRYLKVSGDMGHELFENMRSGDWLIDYIHNRLSFMKDDGGLQNLMSFMYDNFCQVKKL